MEPNRSWKAMWPVWIVFLAITAIVVAVAAAGVTALERTIAAKDAVILNTGEYLLAAERLRADTEYEARLVRTYLRDVDPALVSDIEATRSRIQLDLQQLGDGLEDPEARSRLADLEAATRAHTHALDQVIASQKARPRSPPESGAEALVTAARGPLDQALSELVTTLRSGLFEARTRAQHETQWALSLVEITAFICVVAAFILTLLLRRAMLVQADQQAQLQSQKDRLQVMNQDLEAFAATVAHDLRNALSPIALAAGTLRRRGTDQAQVKAGERIQGALTRATRLMDALLAFSRGGRGSGPEAQSEVRAVLQGALEEAEPLRQERDALLEVEVRGNPRVPMAEGLLHAVIANLVGNALKYIGQSLERRVRVVVGEDESDCVIEVSDTGPGIAREYQDMLFQPSFRVPGQTLPGAGIGLATVDRIVRAHLGRVEVQSELGRGTRFRVYLPLVEAHAVAGLPGESHPLH